MHDGKQAENIIRKQTKYFTKKQTYKTIFYIVYETYFQYSYYKVTFHYSTCNHRYSTCETRFKYLFKYKKKVLEIITRVSFRESVTFVYRSIRD